MRPPWPLLALVAALAAWLGLVLGAWWATFPVGLLVGALAAGRLGALGAGALGGLLGWGLPLAMTGLGGAPLGRTAVVVSAILGVAAGGAPAVAVTLLTGLLLGLSGAWLGFALRRTAGRPGTRPASRS